jgi:hypothetical protein
MSARNSPGPKTSSQHGAGLTQQESHRLPRPAPPGAAGNVASEAGRPVRSRLAPTVSVAAPIAGTPVAPAPITGCVVIIPGPHHWR